MSGTKVMPLSMRDFVAFPGRVIGQRSRSASELHQRSSVDSSPWRGECRQNGSANLRDSPTLRPERSLFTLVLSGLSAEQAH